MSKVPSVSIVGAGKNRSGFAPLPEADTDSPAFAAAKKSRAEKNRRVVKIASVILLVSALLAGLAAFFLTRGSNQEVGTFGRNRESLTMSDEITNIKEVEIVAGSNSKFGLSFYDKLRKEDGNLIMSPFSVSSVMGMLSMGARDSTFNQIQEALAFPSRSALQLGYRDAIPALRSTVNFTLEAANSIFTKKDSNILPEFEQLLHENFHASAQHVDFTESQKAARMINNWVSDMTRQKIQHLIKEDMLTAETQMVLVNAIYFKGDWALKFDPAFTKEADFYVSNTKTVQVPMMKQEKKFKWAKLDSFQSHMVELPYKGDRIVMQIVLPIERAGLANLEDQLKNQDIQKDFEKESYETKLNLQIPKFKLEKRLPLTDVLTELGMKDMFLQGKADFSGVDGTKMLYVSEIVQKAFIEVNEEGSEAAAATGAVLMSRSMPLPPEPFHADHPFVFFIRDTKTGMLLFQGRVVNPKE